MHMTVGILVPRLRGLLLFRAPLLRTLARLLPRSRALRIARPQALQRGHEAARQTTILLPQA